MELDTLSTLTNPDVLSDLRRRVQQMEEWEAEKPQGYKAAIAFYKRIIEELKNG
jgi:hypothetical protein